MVCSFRGLGLGFFRVWGLGDFIRVWGFGFVVLGFRVWGVLGLGVLGVGDPGFWGLVLEGF